MQVDPGAQLRTPPATRHAAGPVSSREAPGGRTHRLGGALPLLLGQSPFVLTRPLGFWDGFTGEGLAALLHCSEDTETSQRLSGDKKTKWRYWQ